MWRWIQAWWSGWRRGRRFRPVSTLPPEALEDALRTAKFLHTQGVSVRALHAGEVPPEQPEIGPEPMR